MSIVSGRQNAKIEIRKQVSYPDLHWECAKERLAARTKATGLEVSLLISQFISEYFSTMNAKWVVPAELVQGQNLVIAALCECHGCDSLSIERNFKLSIGLASVSIDQSLKFSVSAENAKDVQIARAGVLAMMKQGTLRIGSKRLAVEINSYSGLIIFSAITVVIAGLFYALALLLLVHGSAVFIAFLNDPSTVTILATERPEIGVGLLSFLVGLAALLGSAVKMIFRFIKSK